MNVQLSYERLSELLRAAYEDGLDDGIGRDIGKEAVSDTSARLWPESVTYDQIDALKERIRNGGHP